MINLLVKLTIYYLSIITLKIQGARQFIKKSRHAIIKSNCRSQIKKRKRMFPAGLEPATFRVWGGRDNHYTTETTMNMLLRNKEVVCYTAIKHDGHLRTRGKSRNVDFSSGLKCAECFIAVYNKVSIQRALWLAERACFIREQSTGWWR